MKEWAEIIAELCKYPAGMAALTILGLKIIPFVLGTRNNGVSSEDCGRKHIDVQRELSEGRQQFEMIEERLKNMAEKFTNFYEKNDKSSMRILEEIGGKDGLKDRILTMEVKFEDYINKNGGH
jgi:hypothetical protein